MKNIVTMSNIHKRYDSQQIETHALQGVSLEINQGEFVAITGPSVVVNQHCFLLWV